jgi:glycosyltransferase involved in cell wall biosynthesis
VIRLAFVIPTLDQSGAERQLTLLATSLPQSEYTIRVFALNRGGHYQKPLEDAGIPTTVLGKTFRFDARTALRLCAHLHAFQPHVVQSFLFSANTLVRLPGIVPPTAKVIISERCVDSWKAPWQLFVDRHLARHATALVGNSQSVTDFYRQLGVPPEKLHCIPNIAPPAATLLPREAAREALGLPADSPVIGFVGRLAPQKRLRDLVWAFQLLQQVRGDANLVIIGDGPSRNALESLADTFDSRPRITFAGHRSDASTLLSAFDAFVLPSEFEGMSNSLMEAMQHALPCVVSDIPANLELVRPGENGLSFPLGNSPALAKTILRLLNEPPLRRQLGTAAQQTIRNDYTPAVIQAAWCRLYSQLVVSPSAVL